ncbi:MAG: hypothetical protein RL263_1162, partial [Bacteroidota bacterium]
MKQKIALVFGISCLILNGLYGQKWSMK